MKIFVYYEDGYPDDGDQGLSEFDDRAAAAEFITQRMMRRTIRGLPKPSDYTVIEGINLDLVAAKIVTKYVLVTPEMIALHPYQATARDRVLAELDAGRDGALAVMATGTGKTYVGCAVAAEFVRRGGRVLIMAHRGELLRQWARSCGEFNLEYVVEKAEQRARQDTMFGRASVVLGSKDTLQRKRLQEWPDGAFSLIICDECFPAGTLVDGMPIELLEAGDTVSSFSHALPWYGGHVIQRRKVVRTFRRKATSLVRLSFSDGSSLVCTPTHPIFVDGIGYVHAERLAYYPGFCILREVRNDAEGRGSSVRELRDAGGVQRAECPDPGQAGPGLLRGGMQARSDQEGERQGDGEHESGVRLGEDEGQQSDGQAGDQGEGFADDEGDGACSGDPGWERTWTNRPAVGPGERPWLGTEGDDREDRPLERLLRIPNLLQGGPGTGGSQTRDRNRRWIAQDPREANAGLEKRTAFDRLGVDRVEVLEPGSDGTFGGLCPDGHVYNLEVEGNHNYFADGVLVHNCHHGIAGTYLNVFGHFHKAKRLGLTATPERGDGEDIQKVFGNCVFEYPLWKAIEDKFLVPPYFRRPACSVDLSKIDADRKDLNQGDLEDEISQHIEELVNGAKREIGSRYSMAFTPRVGSAQAMASGFRQLDPAVSACSVHGTAEDRDLVVANFRTLDYQALCSCDMLLEGADFPAVSALIMARPTKSETVYKQMLGRGLRTYPGKDHCLIVDYAWNSGRHDLFRPIELFDTTGMDLDVLKLAGDLLDAGKQEDPREALKQAEEIHRREVAMRVTVRDRDPKYRLIAFDPFQIGSLLGVPKRHVGPDAKPLSTKNAHRLEGFKLGTAGISNAEAERLLKELDARRAAGKATHRMVATLVANGVPAAQASELSFDAARNDLDIIIGWSRQERAS